MKAEGRKWITLNVNVYFHPNYCYDANVAVAKKKLILIFLPEEQLIISPYLNHCKDILKLSELPKHL